MRSTQSARLMRHVALPLLVTFLAATLRARTAGAAMIGTDAVMASQRGSSAHGTVMSFLDQEHVVQELHRLGVDPAEAKARVAALSPAEIATLSHRIEDLPAGGNGVGAVVGAIVLIFIILLITDLLGWTNVFPFTEKGALRS